MADAFLRNREGRIIGRFDGSWLRDGTGRLVARYDAGDNRTRDRTGRIVGTGDQRLRAFGKIEQGKWNTPPVLVAGGVDRPNSSISVTEPPSTGLHRDR